MYCCWRGGDGLRGPRRNVARPRACCARETGVTTSLVGPRDARRTRAENPCGDAHLSEGREQSARRDGCGTGSPVRTLPSHDLPAGRPRSLQRALLTTRSQRTQTHGQDRRAQAVGPGAVPPCTAVASRGRWPPLRGGCQAAWPGPLGGPRALWLCRSRALWLESQAGRLSFLCLPTFGEGISSCPGLRVRFPPRWKVPPRGPQRRAHHGNATRRRPDTGQGAAPAGLAGAGQRAGTRAPAAPRSSGAGRRPHARTCGGAAEPSVPGAPARVLPSFLSLSFLDSAPPGSECCSDRTRRYSNPGKVSWGG